MRRAAIVTCIVAMAIAGGIILWTSGARAQAPAPAQTPAPAAIPGPPGGITPLPLVDPMTPKKHVLVLGFTNGWHHGSTTDGEVMFWELGKETGLWDTEIRTDTKWITKDYTGAGDNRNLNWFDAIVAVNTTGTWQLTDQQRKDFISAIHDDGKGFVGVHAALDANHNGVWPEYTEMIGGEFANHPWLTFAAPVIIEDPTFPAMRHFASTHIVLYDEMYVPRSSTWSRDKVNVLMRLDETKLPAKTGSQEPFASQGPVAAQAAGDVTAAQEEAYRQAQQAAAAGNPGRGRGRGPGRGNFDNGIHADQDYAITWAKMYGNGRVFYSSLGHNREEYENPDVRKMYLEAVKWALKLEDGSTESHPKRN
jgi:type 1 glutamine amidotransferase